MSNTKEKKKLRQYTPMLIDRKHCRMFLRELAPPKKKRISREVYTHLNEVMKVELRRVVACNGNVGKTIYPPVRLRPKSRAQEPPDPF